MSLSNLFGWKKKAETETSAACGTACGAADKPEEKPAACVKWLQLCIEICHIQWKDRDHRNGERCGEMHKCQQKCIFACFTAGQNIFHNVPLTAAKPSLLREG